MDMERESESERYVYALFMVWICMERYVWRKEREKRETCVCTIYLRQSGELLLPPGGTARVARAARVTHLEAVRARRRGDTGARANVDEYSQVRQA